MRNRGQDGAGLATIKLDPYPGQRYISRKRTNSPQYLKDLFTEVFKYFEGLTDEQLHDPEWLKSNKPYTGELLMGHLRYGTHGSNSIETVHPFLRLNNWISRNLVVAGNFNLTNVHELFEELVELGQFPKEQSDTVTVMEKIGHFLDDEVQRLFSWYKPDGYNNAEINNLIFEHLDIQRLLKRASKKFDGGFVMAGFIGHGDAFVMRDPIGIRPAFYYNDDEIVGFASERPALQTAFGVSINDIKEIPGGHALIIKKNGRVSIEKYIDPQEKKSCSFERIYFSRGTDRDIYLERKKLGLQLVEPVLRAVDYNIENTVFSFVPNTAEIAFMGMVEGIHQKLSEIKTEKILALGENPKKEEIEKIMNLFPRVEKLAVKDAKMRTFIADEVVRGEMVSHVYDVTYGIVKNEVDTLVLVDDSIVRGTTLRDSIINMAARLKPKKIIIVSSAPQIRYPDCYGIDMSRMNEFVAFRALIDLIHDNKQEKFLQEIYKKSLEQVKKSKVEITNPVKELYELYTVDEINTKIAEIVTPVGIKPKVEIIYQTIDGLHSACPDHKGDWYFSGDYPTPGGNLVVNRAFINFIENKDGRSY
jgi:amidophosphoribosyltransferase